MALSEELYRLALACPEDKDLLVNAIYWKTLVSYSHSSNDAQLSRQIDSLLEIPEIQKDDARYLMLVYSSALTRMTYGNFPEAFRKALQAYQLACRLQDSGYIYQTALMLGNIGPYIQDYEISRKYYDIAGQYIDKRNRNSVFKLAINRSRLFSSVGELDSALLLLVPLTEEYADISDRSLLSVAYLNIGSYLSGLDLKDSAVHYYRVVLELMENSDNNNILIPTYGNIGNYYRYKNMPDSAMYYYRLARGIARKDNNLDQYASIAYEMSVLFTGIGKSDSAYIYI